MRRTIASTFARVNCRLEGLALVALVIGLASGAHAHPQFSPSSINRYVKVDLIAADRVRLVYTLMVGPGPAAAERRAADRNHDGLVSPTESRLLGERARVEASGTLRVWLDGAPLALDFAAPTVGLSGDAVSNDPFSIDLEQAVAPGVGRHRLRVALNVEGRGTAESEIRIVDSPTMQVIAADRGEGAPQKKQLQFQFTGPVRTSLEDRSVTVDFESIGPAPRRGLGLDGLMLGGTIVGGLGLLGVAAWLIARRYRSWKG